MLFTPQPNGSLLVELDTWREFRAKWRDAPPDHRIVLADKRPAVLDPHADPLTDRPTLYTPHWHIWSCVRNLQQLDMPAESRTMRCASCNEPMKPIEHETYWKFACERCHSREIWGKDAVGGTIGAGEREIT